MILALKLLLTPLMITLATLTGRRWGPAVSGWLIGFPLTSGPISIILANQNSTDFATHAAIGTLGGQLSVLTVCLVYSLVARKTAWWTSVLLAAAAYIAATLACNAFILALLPTFGVVLIFTLIVIRSIPSSPLQKAAPAPPAWDIPARIVIATTFVFLLTTFSTSLGPQLSGLIAPFPIYGLVLAAFAHYQQGGDSARQLLRGVAMGSFAFASFFLVVGGLLPGLGSVWTYLLAALVSLLVNGLSLLFFRRNPIQPVVALPPS
jgi:hypothetical protein